MAAAGLLFAAACCGLARNLTPESISERNILYNYDMSVSSSYEVRLVENELYPEGVLGEDRVYARSLIDRLVIDFTAEYSGNKEAPVRGNYSVVVIVEGYQTSGDSRKIIYEKSFPFAENITLNGEGGGVKITERVALDINEYKIFADRADQILNAKPGREARVVFSGAFVAETDHGEIKEPFTYSILLPLSSDLFTITKQNPIKKTDLIAENREIAMQRAPVSFVLPGLVMLAALAAIAFLGFFVRQPTAEELYRSNFKKILRKHGSRMVRLEGPSGAPADLQLAVADLDSLIKMADELQRPVCYALNEEGLPAAGLLYVPDGQRDYLLCLKK